MHGFVGNFEVTLRQKARYVDHSVCNGCGTCWGKCPVKDIPSEFDQGVGEAAAIYLPFPQRFPTEPVIDARPPAARSRISRAQSRQAAEQGLSPEEAVKLKPVGPDRRRTAPLRHLREAAPRRKPVHFGDRVTPLVTERFGAIVVAKAATTCPCRRDATTAPRSRRSASPTTASTASAAVPDVITALQLERLMNAWARPRARSCAPPTAAPARRRFIACVGSRDEKVGHPVLLEGLLHVHGQAGHHAEGASTPGSRPTSSTSTPAPAAATSAARAAHPEAFGPGSLPRPRGRVYRKGDRYVVQGYDALIGRPGGDRADLVVLANGMTSSRGAVELMQKLGISYDGYGFMNEAHVKLRPVETNTAGVYLAGCAAGPKDIPDTVAQASACRRQGSRSLRPAVHRDGADDLGGALGALRRLPRLRRGLPL